MSVAGWEIRVDGGTIIDAGLTKPYTVTGLVSGLHDFELRAYDADGNRSAWTAPITVNAFLGVSIRLDAGRLAGGVVGGFDIDSYFEAGSGVGDFADSVDITGLINPAPAAAYSKYRLYTSDFPTYTFDHSDMVPGKAYLLRCHFNEGNTSHVLGESVMEIHINGVIAAPIRDAAFRNSKYFDVRERAGAFHKGYIREYLAVADGSGIIVVLVRNAVNNSGGDVRISAIELLEAPPVANFTATPGVNQTLPVAFADTSTGEPTAWAWDFGDGNSATSQNPTHTYASAGSYTVTLIASNIYGDSESHSAVVAVPSTDALTVTPSSLPDAQIAVAYSQAVSATGGTAPYSSALIAEASDAREYTDLGSGVTRINRRGALPNGLALASGTISGTPNLSSAKPSRIVFAGTSIMKGFIGADPAVDADYTPSAWLAKLLPRSWDVVNTAVSGRTLAQVHAGYAGEVSPFFGANFEFCIALHEGGYNDIIGAISLATMESETAAWFAAAKADGFLTIGSKMVANPNWGGPDATKAASWNAYLDTLADCDIVIDPTDDPLLANMRHNTYFNDGGIHNTELGQIRRAIGIKAAVDTLSPSGSGAIAVDYKFAVKVVDALGNAQTKQYTLTVNP